MSDRKLKIPQGKKFLLPPNRANGTIKGQLNTPADVQHKLKKFKLAPSELVPVDWRNIMREYGLELSPPQDQERCGNCWAFASLCSLRDRWEFKLKKNGLDLTPLLGTQCAEQINNGCNGGHPENAIEYFANYGVVQKSDICPDFADICKDSECNGRNFPSCDELKLRCYKEGATIFRAKHPRKAENRGSTLAATDPLTTIYNMKAELQDRNYGGPFPACFIVPWDFMVSGAGYRWEKTGGIFITGEYNKELDAIQGLGDSIGKPANANWTDMSGRHCVEIVGHSKENVPGYGEIEYWIVKNTWGPNWNDKGYVKFAMNNKPDGKGYNSNLGLDIPIYEGGLWFGSGTVAEPDLDNFKGLTPEDEKNLHTTTDTEKSSNSSDHDMKLFYIFMVVVLVAVLVYLVTKQYKPEKLVPTSW